MKFRVQQEDGSIEVLTIVPPATIAFGSAMHKIVSACGLEHWFTSDGYYDGWGQYIGDIPMGELVDRVETSREVTQMPEILECDGLFVRYLYSDISDDTVREAVRMPSGEIVVRIETGESLWFDRDGRHPKSELFRRDKGEGR